MNPLNVISKQKKLSIKKPPEWKQGANGMIKMKKTRNIQNNLYIQKNKFKVYINQLSYFAHFQIVNIIPIKTNPMNIRLMIFSSYL